MPLLSSLKDCLIEISKYLTDYFKLKLANSIHCILNDFVAMKIMKGWNKNGTATTYQKPDDFESFIKAQLSEYEYDNSSAATPATYAWNSQDLYWISDTKLYVCNLKVQISYKFKVVCMYLLDYLVVNKLATWLKIMNVHRSTKSQLLFWFN